MTVSTSTARTEYFASGGTNYNIGFWINSVDHLMVYVADNDGVALTNGVDYNFVVNPTGVGRWTSENADPGTGIDPVNTTVDIYLGNTQVDPLPDGYTVILLRHMPFTQAIKWLNSGGMFPISSENSADFIIQTLQEMEEKISRCPLADPTSDLSGDDFYAELVALSESATASAAAASSSADDAAADAALVQAQIVIAEGYADDALNSATASAASAVQSQDQVALAEAFAIAAEASATDAESAETNAAASAITAGLSETAAGLSEAAAASSASDAEDFKDQAESARDAAIAAGDFFATIGTGGTYETFYDAVQAASASQTSFVFEVVSDIEDSKSSVTFGNGQTVTVYASNYRVRKNTLASMFIMDPSSSIVWYGGNPQAGLNAFIQVNANASAKFLGSDLSTDTPATDTFAYGQGYIEFDRCYAGSGTGGTVIGHQSLPASVRFTDCTISATNIVSYYTDLAVDGSRVVVERSNLVGGFKELNDVSVDMEMTLVVDINSTVTDTLGTATHLVRLNAAVASGVRYTPTNPADWTDPDPTTVQDALDDLAGGGGVTDHDDLTNRDAEDQHPISAITGLEDALGEKFDAAGGGIEGDVDIDGYLSVSGGLTTGATGVDTALAYDCAFLDRTSRPWPILAESQRDSATKALGSVCYNDDTSRLEIWNGSAWLPVAGGGGVTDHDDLTSRDAENSHPISAITGLEDTLDTIDDKEDALGNPSSDGYVLSSSAAGVRSWVAGGGGGVTDHDDLTNRDAEDQHPISAITGLDDALDTIDDKEDALGNPSSDGYVLSSSAAGVRSWVAGGGGGDYLPLAGGTMVNGADVIWPASGSDQWIIDPSGGTFAVKHHDETTPATLNVLRLIHHAEGVNYARVSGDVRVDARLTSDTAMIGSSVAQHASASLELADDDRAMILNRFASSDPASYVATPAEGMLGYDPVAHRAVLNDGTAWRDVVTAGDLAGKEDYLGVPLPGPTMVLSSTSGGVRSWVGLGDTSLWELLTATTDYATAGYTAASYLTITMNADHSPNIKMGMLMRAAIGGTKYPFYVVSCTPTELVLAGNVAPFTGGAISSLSYCTAHNPWITHPLIVPGSWCDTLDTTLLQHDLELIYCWNNEPAYLTAVECATPTLSGTPGFAVTVGGTAYTEEIVPSASSLPTYTGVTSSASTPLTANAASPVRIELDVTTAVAAGNSGLYVTLFYAPQKLVEAL